MRTAWVGRAVITVAASAVLGWTASLEAATEVTVKRSGSSSGQSWLQRVEDHIAYRQTVTDTSTVGASSAGQTHAIFSGGDVLVTFRDDFLELVNVQAARAPGYILFKASTGKALLVDSARKMFANAPFLDPEGPEALMKAMKIKVRYGEPTVRLEKLGTEPVAGVDCLRYRLLVEYLMETRYDIKLAADAWQKSQQHMELEYWVDPARLDIAAATTGLVRLLLTARTPSREINAMVDAKLRELEGAGMPIKGRLSSSTAGSNRLGQSTSNAQASAQWELTGLRDVEAPAGLFEVPGDYQQVDFQTFVGLDRK